ncbi:MAG: hypothetical protein MJY79_08905, partial [Bacteroidaceae bacterium]|nr:hypothetical protein [Bacteroidaceae bacterium]
MLILQLIILTEQQISEEFNEEGFVWLYAFLRITVIGAYQGVTEVPGIISEQLNINIETARMQILYYEYRCCSSITFAER